MPYDGERSQEAVIDFLSAHVGGEGTVDSLKDVVKEFVLSDESSREKVAYRVSFASTLVVLLPLCVYACASLTLSSLAQPPPL